MTIGQEWSTIVKAFTINELSIEEKEKLFESQKSKDSSDTSKLKRYTCDALKTNKEEFLKIYEEFKNPNNEQSTTVKEALKAGWLSTVHEDWLLELKPKYFTDIVEASKNLKGDHLEFFAIHLEPIDDDLEATIKGYEGIKLEGEKFDKLKRDFLKIIDNLKRRRRAYAKFEEKANL